MRISTFVKKKKIEKPLEDNDSDMALSYLLQDTDCEREKSWAQNFQRVSII